jgi:Chaperone of endosialidase
VRFRSLPAGRANHDVPIRLAKSSRFSNPLRMKTKASPTRDSVNRSLLRGAFLLNALALAFACFALSPPARAVCQEGCLTDAHTVLGDDALLNKFGSANTAVGFNALLSNTTCSSNTAIGFQALYSNATGFSNTATGILALYGNTAGYYNTANGSLALYHNTTGFDNTATGHSALNNNTTGFRNTATGSLALYSNTSGNKNTASGINALQSNTTGSGNTADGQNAMRSNTTGSFNIAMGFEAGVNLTTGSFNIDIGNKGVPAESNTIRIGNTEAQNNTYIAGISGATVPTGVAVIVDGSGHLGTTTSSARFKEAIKPMDKASEAILALKPVTFRYKHELDPDAIPQFGLVAEEVEKVSPDLVARDEQGKPYTVRYEAVNAMLLNEFLKEHRKVEQLEKQVGALTAGLHKVSAQLELSKFATGRIRRGGPAPQTARE